jgi:hypothetical protein
MAEEIVIVADKKLTEEERLAAEEAAREAAIKRQSILDNLAQFVENDYNQKRAGRASKKDQWIRSLALYHSPLADGYIKDENEFFEGRKRPDNKPFPNIVRSRCNNVISELIQGQFATGSNWAYKPSPAIDALSVVPELQNVPEAVVDASQRMQKTVEDQLNDCNYKREYSLAIEDFVILGSGVLKGPRNSCKYRKTYVREYSEDGQEIYVTKIVPIPRPGVWRVNPFFFFPDYTTNDGFKMESATEVHPFTRTEMQNLQKHSGFLSDQIEKAMECGVSSDDDDIFDYLSVSETGVSTPNNKYIIKEHHGPVKVSTLFDLDIICDCDGYGETVMAEVWVCNGKTVRIALPVLDDETEIPYAVAAYVSDPGSVLGFGLPLLLESQQRIVRTATGMLLDNAAVSSGPQVAIDGTQFSQEGVGQDKAIRPWKVWEKTEFGEGGIQDAIQFFMPPNAVEQLTGLIGTSMQWAEIDSGVSEMIGGLTSPQGVETGGATGLAIANRNALTPLLYKQEILIENLTARVIRWMYDWNMQYNPDPSIKGDFEVDVTTPIKNIRSQQEKVDMERIMMLANQDPEAASWLKKDQMSRWYFAGMTLPSVDFIRTPEEREQWLAEQQANQGPDPNVMKAEAEMMNAQTKQQEVQLEFERLQFDREEGERQSQREYMSYMENQETRLMEAQIRLLTTQQEKEIALIQMATKYEGELARVQAELEKNNTNAQVQLFLGGQKAGLDMQKIRQTDQELQLKRQGKTGV